ncbi:hypothetical protein NQ246_26810, partial [Escherichia coli]|nr:hypothetical protein [Escherichia coli]
MIAAGKADQDLDVAMTAVVGSLPPLPPLVRYHDDFADEIRTLREFSKASFVKIEIDGRRERIEFDRFGS